jgi:hypothetical protein
MIAFPGRYSKDYEAKGGRVARWHILKPKISIWVNFGGSCHEKCWYIAWPFSQILWLGQCHIRVWYIFVATFYIVWPLCIFCGHLEYILVIWYNFSVLKNLALLRGCARNPCRPCAYPTKSYKCGLTNICNFHHLHTCIFYRYFLSGQGFYYHFESIVLKNTYKID